MIGNSFGYLEYLSQVIAVVSLDGDIKYLNLKARALLGVVNDSQKMNLLEVLEKFKLTTHKDEVTETLMTVYQSKQRKHLTLENEDNQQFTFHFFMSKEDIVVEVLGQSDNVILQKDIFNFIVKNSSDIIFFKGEDLVYQLVNDAYLKLLNIKEEDIIGITDDVLVERGILSPILYHSCLEGDRETLEQGSYCEIEFFSTEKYYEVSKKKLRNGILCFARDVSNEVNISHQSEINSITGLYNRKALCRMLSSIPEDKEYHTVEIILENFGEVIKNYDLQYANRCLKQLSQLVKEYSEALFFYLDGVAFVGLFDRRLRNPDQVRESIIAQISNLNLPFILTVELTMKNLNTQSGLFSICEL